MNKLLSVREQTSKSTRAGPGETIAPGPLTRAELSLAIATPVVILLVVWISQFVEPTPVVHRLAQFVHLACVVVGLGSVLAVDWFGLRWQLGHSSLESVVTTAGALAIPIWFGLGGLVLSGMFLQPDLSSTLTQVKIGTVVGAGVIGALALSTQRRLTAAGPFRPHVLVRQGLILAATSQICWWTAAVIGFLNRS